MRSALLVIGLACVSGCGSSTTGTDMAVTVNDMAMMMSSTGDMAGAAVTPYNHPGMVNCYKSPACTVASASPICCDESGADGGFIDTCVAAATDCTGKEATAYQCGQAADCGSGMVCCGTVSTNGKDFSSAGTVCAASCGTGQTQLCVAASECKTGTMCTGISLSGRDVGLCK